MEFTTGRYELGQGVIRSDPFLVESDGEDGGHNNHVALVMQTETRQLAEIKINEDESVWGRLTEYDKKGKAEWFCLYDKNNGIHAMPLE